MNKEPLLIWSSILVTLQVLTGGAALTDAIGASAAGVCILVVAALQAGTQFYTRGQVTPNESVAALVDADGNVLAGKAASAPEGAPVNVMATGRRAG